MAQRRIRRAALLGLAVVALVAPTSVAADVAVDPVPAAASTRISGIDVASWQHPSNAPIDWAAVRASGQRFAYVKATEGTNYTNPWYAPDVAGAEAAGLARGAYHFARPALPLDSAVAQARYFVSVIGAQRSPGDLPPVLDLEVTGGLGPADLAQWTRLFLNETERLTGRRPMLYSGYYFWRDEVGNPTDVAASGIRFWIARYTSAPDPLPLPGGWSTWTMWQYTSVGRVPGIAYDVDVNWFCCDEGTFAALADGTTADARASNPFGSLDAVRHRPDGVEVVGWAIDPDTTQPLDIHLYADGALVGVATSDVNRNDVAAAFPGWGPAHGFATVLDLGPGDHRVCAYAINRNGGTSNPLLGCRSVVSVPIGALDATSAPAAERLTARGWAIDPDVPTGPVDVHVYLNGRFAAVATADVDRPDLAEAFPTAGAAHGWQVEVAAAPGRNTVCAYGINVGAGGQNPLLGCSTRQVLGHDPVGNLDGATPGLRAVDMRGWALDASLPAPAAVHVYVDGGWAGATTASVDRDDVRLALATTSTSTGWHVTVPAAPGRRRVCAYAINAGPGRTNPLLGCRDVTVSGTPFGPLDEVVATGTGVEARGWVLDPDTASPVQVHVYVDGAWAAAATADRPRPDVAAVFPWWGDDVGFLVPLGPGAAGRQVCVYAIDVGPGPNPRLGCRTAPG